MPEFVDSLDGREYSEHLRGWRYLSSARPPKAFDTPDWPHFPGDIETNDGQLAAFERFGQEHRDAYFDPSRLVGNSLVHDNASTVFVEQLRSAGWWRDDSHFVDIGTGPGTWPRRILDKQWASSAEGVDAYAPIIEYARGNDARPNLRFRILPATPDSIGSIVANKDVAYFRSFWPSVGGRLIESPFGRRSERMVLFLSTLDAMHDNSLVVIEEIDDYHALDEWGEASAFGSRNDTINERLLLVGPALRRTAASLFPSSVLGRKIKEHPQAHMTSHICEYFFSRLPKDHPTRAELERNLETMRTSSDAGAMMYERTQLAIQVDGRVRQTLRTLRLPGYIK